jgi:hypothetical protein
MSDEDGSAGSLHALPGQDPPMRAKPSENDELVGSVVEVVAGSDQLPAPLIAIPLNGRTPPQVTATGVLPFFVLKVNPRASGCSATGASFQSHHQALIG